MDRYYGVPQSEVCPTGHKAYLNDNEVEETRVENE